MMTRFETSEFVQRFSLSPDEPVHEDDLAIMLKLLQQVEVRRRVAASYVAEGGVWRPASSETVPPSAWTDIVRSLVRLARHSATELKLKALNAAFRGGDLAQTAGIDVALPLQDAESELRLWESSCA